jgi:hypothetical protein
MKAAIIDARPNVSSRSIIRVDGALEERRGNTSNCAKGDSARGSCVLGPCSRIREFRKEWLAPAVEVSGIQVPTQAGLHGTATSGWSNGDS